MHHGKRVTSILSKRLPLALDALGDPPGDGTLVFGGPEVSVLADLPQPVQVVSGHRPDHDRLSTAAVTMCATADRASPAGTALVLLPRNRVQAMGWIAEALSLLPAGGVLIVDGAKTDGVEPVLKALKAALPLEGTVSKAHGKIAWGYRPELLPPELETWCAAAGSTPNGDGLITAPGMFSADGLDAGTAALIAHLPRDAKGVAADLGAGWGALSAALLTAAPGLERLDLIEADHASLEAARANVTDPRAAFHWADATRFDGGPYRLIVSNPPFHTGRTADPSLGQAFIAAAHRLLHPKGRFLLVANRQLPYEKTLEHHFHAVTALRADARFKVIDAHHPRRRLGG